MFLLGWRDEVLSVLIPPPPLQKEDRRRGALSCICHILSHRAYGCVLL